MLTPQCGAWLGDDGVCRWVVWAPQISHVDLLLYGDGDEPARHAMTPGDEGHYRCEQTGIVEGQRYAFQLDGGPVRPDPASLWQPGGVHAPSAVWSPESFAWTDAAWKNVSRTDLVIYELHVGTFTAEGTFDAVIPRLAALAELGVTAIELMPVGEFPGTRGWGYDGTYWYAAQSSYGGPHGLQRLVDACHAHGLAVLLDVVYNHLGPEGNYLREFGPYFTDRYATAWGPAVNFDGPGSANVRRFVLDNVQYWLCAFHLDGLRLDAVHALHDASPVHLLVEIQRTVVEEIARQGRPIHVIAESNLNDAVLLDPHDRQGHGLDAQWNDDFHHTVHALLTGERHGYYIDFDDPPRQLAKTINDIFVYDGGYSRFRDRPHGKPVGDHPGDRFVVSIQNHDQVGNRPHGERLSALVAPAQQRLAAGLLLLSPQIPMLFMGEEYGESRPFPFFCDFGDTGVQDAVRRGRRAEFDHIAVGDVPDPFSETTFASAVLTWSWPDGTVHAGLRRLYRDLLALRRTQPALRDYHNRRAELIETQGGRVLVIHRGDADRPGERLWAAFNLGDRPAVWSPPDWPECRLELRSEEADYGGAIGGDPSERILSPWEFVVFGCAPLGSESDA
ncbi:MAG: malto-oligosyltrehalose trehalohydrolase [Planctomycetaceae bacterium]|nr:malto-oligosyltrehalose trehalohydrolase [Planctomycetaceae bacterium]